MKFSQFVDVITGALYNEGVLAGKSEFQLGEILERYGLSLEPRWGERLFDDYTFSSRIDSRRHIGPLVQQRVSLSPEGLRWVEDELGENVASFLERNGASYTAPENVLQAEDGSPITLENGEYIFVGGSPNTRVTEDGRVRVTEDGAVRVTEPSREQSFAPSRVEGITVDSSAWTGITKVVIDARNARTVSGLIDKAILALPTSRAGNFEVMQATAYLKAAKELVDAPEPPSEEIWRLISKAADLVGLLGLFYTIFVQAIS